MNTTTNKTTHTHIFTRSKPTATVETCTCGKFQHTEHAGESIVEVKPTHTPGPWEAKYQPFSPAHTIGKRAANGSLNLIADLVHSVPQLEERQANANLIAAAPELLTVAKGCLGYLQTLPIEVRPDLVWLKPLLEAIAKAEGRG